MSYGALSRATGIHDSTISQWFTGGRHPSPLYKRLVEEALGMNPVESGDADEELRRAVFNHPDLAPEDAAHFWRYIRLVIRDNRQKRFTPPVC